jgi:hypothetical protein
MGCGLEGGEAAEASPAPVVFEGLAELETGGPGHDHVEEDQIGLGTLGQPKSLVRVVCMEVLAPLCREAIVEHHVPESGVVDNQDSFQHDMEA